MGLGCKHRRACQLDDATLQVPRNTHVSNTHARRASLQEKRILLVPVADMINHSDQPNVEYEISSSRFELRATEVGACSNARPHLMTVNGTTVPR